MPETTEDVLARLSLSYLETASDRLDLIDRSIDQIFHGTGNRGALYFELQKEIHSLKGSAGSYGYPLITTIAHRLEDYMESSRRLEKDQWLDVQKLVDEIRSIIETGQHPKDSLHSQILARLPTSSGAARRQLGAGQFTALLVMNSGVQRKFVGTELVASGIDVTFADHPLQALDLIFKLQPDAVFCSQEFPDISGADLCKMLSAVDAGKALPFAILTSTESLSAAQLGVSEQVGIIQKDANIYNNIMAFLGALASG